MIQRTVIGIVGVGNVGRAAAYALFNQRLASEIILVDLDPARAEGEAMDLMHGQILVGSTRVRAGSYEDLARAQVIVITAGASQQSPDESRLGLLERNAAIFDQIVAKLDAHAPESLLVVATNPVDVLTYVTQLRSERPSQMVIGTGTLLDTARFRALLGAHYNVDPRSVHAYILGEHGDSEVPIWSNANIGGQMIRTHEVLGRRFHADAMHQLFEHARDAAYEIIERKGHTDSAIGVVITRIIRSVLGDEKSVLPISTRTEGRYGLADVCLSIPCVVGNSGVEAQIMPELSVTEHKGLEQSGAVLRSSLHDLGM
jgi:L-lactate dehydrogenase